MPAIQRYNKRLRAIKEIRRMLDELNNTKSKWENSVHGYRNNQLVKRFSNQLKKLNKYVIHYSPPFSQFQIEAKKLMCSDFPFSERQDVQMSDYLTQI